MLENRHLGRLPLNLLLKRVLIEGCQGLVKKFVLLFEMLFQPGERCLHACIHAFFRKISLARLQSLYVALFNVADVPEMLAQSAKLKLRRIEEVLFCQAVQEVKSQRTSKLPGFRKLCQPGIGDHRAPSSRRSSTEVSIIIISIRPAHTEVLFLRFSPIIAVDSLAPGVLTSGLGCL